MPKVGQEIKPACFYGNLPGQLQKSYASNGLVDKFVFKSPVPNCLFFETFIKVTTFLLAP